MEESPRQQMRSRNPSRSAKTQPRVPNVGGNRRADEMRIEDQSMCRVGPVTKRLGGAFGELNIRYPIVLASGQAGLLVFRVKRSRSMLE
jgi:hypothetical protein